MLRDMDIDESKIGIISEVKNFLPLQRFIQKSYRDRVAYLEQEDAFKKAHTFVPNIELTKSRVKPKEHKPLIENK